MSKLQLGMSKEEFYKVMAIALAVSLVMSWALFYGYYVDVQPYIKLPEQPFKALHVEGIVSVYKNGKLVHEGPDVLTSSFYDMLPFLLGNVCTNAPSGSPCPSSNFASTVFTAGPPIISCQVTISGTTISSATYKWVPHAGTTGTPIYIGVGQGTTATPGDCVLNPVAITGVTTSVYSFFTGNPNNPPAPCPNPAQGCVQISATMSFSSTQTISDTMLYAGVAFPASSPQYTLIAHDIIQSVNVNAGDTLTVVYTFIFPGIPTSAGAYSDQQGGIAALFAQCLSRTFFGLGSPGNRICLDSVLLSGGGIVVWIPDNPCSDSKLSLNTVSSVPNKITIATNAGQKYVQIFAPMSAGGNGIQYVTYYIGIPNWANPSILIASQPCSRATSPSFQFVAQQAVGLQLNFP